MNRTDDTWGEETLRLEVRPEVEEFVAAVRAAFADLTPDDRDDLLGGLEADVSELVADRGVEALGDPVAYARELRAAAGFPEPRRSRRPVLRRANVGVAVTEWLDRAHEWGEELLGRLPWGLGDVVAVLRPVWWVARGWAVVVLLDLVLRGRPNAEFLPTPNAFAGAVLVALAVLASVLVGTGRWWTRRSRPGARLALLVVNALCVVLVPSLASSAYDETYWGMYDLGYVEGNGYRQHDEGLWLDGRRVCNLQPFDAAGDPLFGVQLFDQAGVALDVDCSDRRGRGRMTAYPWYLGDIARRNVFPQAERLQKGDSRGEAQPDAYDSETPPSFPAFDRSSVPAVTHPLAEPGEDASASDADSDGRGRAR